MLVRAVGSEFVKMEGAGTVSFPMGDKKVRYENSVVGVQEAENIPSPATRSGGMPSSFRLITSPDDAVTVTGPTGNSQLMLNADNKMGAPT